MSKSLKQIKFEDLMESTSSNNPNAFLNEEKFNIKQDEEKTIDNNDAKLEVPFIKSKQYLKGTIAEVLARHNHINFFEVGRKVHIHEDIMETIQLLQFANKNSSLMSIINTFLIEYIEQNYEKIQNDIKKHINQKNKK